MNGRPSIGPTPSTSVQSDETPIPITRSGSPGDDRIIGRYRCATIPSNTPSHSESATKLRGDVLYRHTPSPGRSTASRIRTNRDSSSNGSGRSSSVFTRLKMPAAPPIPSASVTITIAVNPGARRSDRMADHRSCLMPVIYGTVRTLPAEWVASVIAPVRYGVLDAGSSAVRGVR